VASGSLDEDVIVALVAQGAPIDAYGVGTRMAVSYDAPSLDSAYKPVAVGDRPVLKLSPGKATVPGPKQVFRDPGGDSGDMVGLRDEPPPGDRRPLLAPVMATAVGLARPIPRARYASATGSTPISPGSRRWPAGWPTRRH
jgi:nicotinate phosphoribosyltransferase